MILKHLNKNKLHHAYLIEGAHDKIVLEIIKFCESINIKTFSNPDFVNISIDNFKIDEAFDLRSMSNSKSFCSEKKIFVIYANSISLDAQNVLLKLFEEPIENTHFFFITPDTNSLLKTFISRFYFISASISIDEDIKEAEKFIIMPFKNRLDFIKELLSVPEDLSIVAENKNDIAPFDSARSKALIFLNKLEFVLHKKTVSKEIFDTRFFKHFFKVREFLRIPGSSTKSLMESIALVVPDVGRL